MILFNVLRNWRFEVIDGYTNALIHLQVYRSRGKQSHCRSHALYWQSRRGNQVLQADRDLDL